MDFREHTLRVRHTGGIVGELVFIVVVMFASMTAALVVLGGINPLSSGVITGVLAAALATGLVHHLWYARHRHELERDPHHHAERERRGY